MGDEKSIRGGNDLKNFDQWTEEVSKEGFTQQDDEEKKKPLLKADEIFVEDDFEEE